MKLARYAFVTLLAFYAAVPSPARAELITFDDLPGIGRTPIPDGYGGFTWGNFFSFNAAYFDDGRGGYFPYISSPNVADAPFGGGDIIPVAGTFNLNSLYIVDLAGAYSPHIFIEGIIDGNPAYELAFEAPTIEFLSLNWTGLTELQINGLDPEIDNLDVSFNDTGSGTSNITPEPCSLILVASGILSTLSLHRRK